MTATYILPKFRIIAKVEAIKMTNLIAQKREAFERKQRLERLANKKRIEKSNKIIDKRKVHLIKNSLNKRLNIYHSQLLKIKKQNTNSEKLLMLRELKQQLIKDVSTMEKTLRTQKTIFEMI